MSGDDEELLELVDMEIRIFLVSTSLMVIMLKLFVVQQLRLLEMTKVN